MLVTTRSIIFSELPDRNESLEVRVEHEAYDECPYGIDIGCISEWLTADDFEALIKALKKAQLLRKRALTE